MHSVPSRLHTAPMHDTSELAMGMAFLFTSFLPLINSLSFQHSPEEESASRKLGMSFVKISSLADLQALATSLDLSSSIM
jgi:hypothetical protein